MTSSTARDHSTGDTSPPTCSPSRNRKFGLGQVMATPGALALLATRALSPWSLIDRHVHGDWGDICNEDRDTNEAALQCGSRLMSVYRLVTATRLDATPESERHKLPTIWIITEATDDHGFRRATTLLLPDEY